MDVLYPPENRGLARRILDEGSGALITVTFALEQGRDVFAVPGPITSRMSDGANRLIKDGAKCVTSAADILQDTYHGQNHTAPTVR